MAHTLKAYYHTFGATAATVDFYGGVASNSGIAVTSYQMGIPGVEQARNNSLYGDSVRLTWSKHNTATDVLTVDVKGSTNTALYTNLHLLAKLGEYARRAKQEGRNILPAYLELKPGGSSAGEVLYATIYDCRVDIPSDWANTQDARLTIEDVNVTIERGLWRSTSPVALNPYDDAFTQSGVAMASGAASSSDVGGDTSPMWFIDIGQTGTTVTIDRAIIGIRSKLRGGSSYYASLGKFESESATLGTDTSAVVDATASGGNVARCTQTTSPSTPAVRVSGAKIPIGTHRMFARMKITGSAVSSVYLSYADDTVANGATFTANTAVTVSSTSWYVYDLGIVNAFVPPGYTGSGSLGTYQVYSSLTSGAGNLDIDWVFCMPTEGYVTANNIDVLSSSAFCTVNAASEIDISCYTYLSSKTNAIKRPAFTASVDMPPGAFAVYWILATNTGDYFDAGIQTSAVINLKTLNRYLMPSKV